MVMGIEEKEKAASVDEVLKMLMGSGASEIVVERVYTKKKTGKGIKISSLGSMGSEGSDEEKEQETIKETLQAEQEYKEHIEQLKTKNKELETENKELKKENSELKHYCEKEMPLIFLSIRQNIDELKKYNENLTHSLEEVKTRSTDDLKKCVALNKEIETLKRKLEKNRTGKRTELSSVEIEKVINGYCEGLSYSTIAARAGCSRMQVSRVIKGEFKHTQSKEKIVRVLNKLLKINQNPQRVEKLKELKEKYL